MENLNNNVISYNLELDEIAKISKKSRIEAGKRAKKLGLDKMTMDEINEEISMARSGKMYIK